MSISVPETLSLNDGREVGLAWLGPQDAAPFAELACGLDADELNQQDLNLEDQEAVCAWLAEIGRTCFHVLAARDPGQGDALIGYAFLKRGRYSAAHRAMVASLLHPSFRNLGLGSGLLREVAHLGEDLGLMFLEAEIPASRRDLVASYKRLGFELKAILEDYRVDRQGRPYDVIILMKRLYHQVTQEFLYRY
ncbi:MAG: GNAT family N-acetyltransferase [Deltaproteobacteria bacterium]|nr:GNAT family N-acetyltransferase [Deltaproteobacteria bacterium]